LFKNNNETTPDEHPSFMKSNYNCHAAIQGYIAAGTPRSKLVMGLGLYGRGWQGKFFFLK
jgi:GH18 family chitinase